MNELISAVNGLSAAWAAALWRASWQGAIAVAAVWIACRAWQRMPPHLRVWLWRLAYLKLVLGLLICIRPVHLPLLPPSPAPVTTAAAPSVEVTPPDNLGGGTQAMASDALESVTLRPVVWLFALWLLGLGWQGTAVVRSWRRARQLQTDSTDLDDPDLEQYVRDLCREQGLPPPRLAAGAGEGPLVLGLGRPTVLVPAALMERCRPAELRLILVHELAHLKRRDLAWNWLPVLARWLFFFHPLVWLAQREWRLAHEMAADALALQMAPTNSAAYGQMLVKVVAALGSPRTRLATVGIAESRETLERRILAMAHLAPTTRRWMTVAAVVIGVLALIFLVPWRLSRRPGPLGDQMAALAAQGEMEAQASASDKDLLEQLRAGMAQRRSSITSCKGSVHLVRTRPLDEGARVLGERVVTVAFDGNRLRMSGKVLSGNIAANFEGAFDGESTTEWLDVPGDRAARIYPGLGGVTGGEFSLFVDPRGIGGGGWPDPDPDTGVTVESVGREVLDGRDCTVVEWISPIPENTSGAYVKVRVWVDVGRGCVVPKLRAWYAADSEADLVLLQEQVVEFKQYGDGLWVPAAFTRVVYHPDGTFEKRIVATYDPDFQINVPISEDELRLTLPSGMKVYDTREGAPYKLYTVP